MENENFLTEERLAEDITKITDDFNQLNFISSQKLADTNDPDRIYLLGYCYEYGIGVEKDENKAFTYYQKSADMNNSNGMYQVGYCYYLGIGVEIDKHRAFTYYLKSAEAGNSMGIWKTAIYYYYGIGEEENYDKFQVWMDNSSFYGICAHCNEDNTSEAWCISCDPDITTRWTSRNKDIDECMKVFQLRTRAYEDVIELIPFDRLYKIKEIGKGGFGSVYSAIWLDGIRKIEKIKKHDDNDDSDDNYIYKRSRDPNSIVALKTLSGSIKEFDNHLRCSLFGARLKIYGLTQTNENKCLMVFQLANGGNLNKFLRTNFQDLTWKVKLKLLQDISSDLKEIHNAGYIHGDFHSGNILQDRYINKTDKTVQSYITDLGLSKKEDENDSEGDIYGVMPYVAPEVLLGQKFTKAADVYGLGVMMTEVSTGQRPFDGYELNTGLATQICKGLRPEFAPGTPDCYIELAKKCLNSDPSKRPSAHDVYFKLRMWSQSMKSSDDADEIKKQFLDADKIAKTLPMVSPKHSDFTYTSKIINTQSISSAIKAISTSIPIDSVEIPAI